MLVDPLFHLVTEVEVVVVVPEVLAELVLQVELMMVVPVCNCQAHLEIPHQQVEFLDLHQHSPTVILLVNTGLLVAVEAVAEVGRVLVMVKLDQVVLDLISQRHMRAVVEVVVMMMERHKVV